MLLSQSASDDFQNETSFMNLSTQLSAFLRQEGISNRAYNPGLVHFKALDAEKKRAALRHLEFYNSLCLDHQMQQQALRDSQKFTWRALSKFGFTPPSDLLNKISREDVVEIYSEDHIQLFRNFEFFEVCSYTLEELFCIEWWNLFVRPPEINGQLLNMAHQLLAGKAPKGFQGGVPVHVLTEASSESRFAIHFDMQYLMPLYRNKRVEALISIVKAKVVQ
jgi:hypothetical protein